MDLERDVLRELAGRGVGSETIARMVGVARNTVRPVVRSPGQEQRSP